MKIRVLKRLKYQRHHIGMGRYTWTAEDRAWMNMASMGREFGSPDYEKLMEQDRRRAAIRAMRAFPKVRIPVGDLMKLSQFL